MSLLLCAWAVAAVVVVALFSGVEGSPVEEQLERLGFGAVETGTLETAAGIVLIVAVAVHLLAALLTSRAQAAMVGAVGGLIGALVAGAAALSVAAGLSGARADAIGELTQPAAIATVAIIGVVVGARAYLAHIGRWRYAKNLHTESWGDYAFD